MKTRNILLLIFLLVLIDQSVKLIIYSSFMNVNCEIIHGVLDFNPLFNSKYSFVNYSLHKSTGMDMGALFHIALFALVWLILFLGYRFFKSIDSRNKTLDVATSFFTAAVICSYLGMLVWEKGTLDFLHIKRMMNIIFDLKDIYINCFVVLFNIGVIQVQKKYRVKLADLKNYLKGLFKHH